MDTKELVRQFVVTNFYVPDGIAITDDQSLLDSGVIDSTGVLELIAFVEDRFSIQIEDQEMVPANLDSIGRVAEFVSRKQAALVQR